MAKTPGTTATEHVWSEPDAEGRRKLLFAPGDIIPEGTDLPGRKAKKAPAKKAAQGRARRGPAEDRSRKITDEDPQAAVPPEVTDTPGADDDAEAGTD